MNKKEGKCESCMECPSNSFPTKLCPSKAKHCECILGMELETSPTLKCVPCDTFTCPAYSTQKKQCATKFKDCKCDKNYKADKDTEKCVPKQ
mmetsp:Transcript_21250/g.25836  ORF Transcript_21250/g.25836 Transcript_21250/m.25836 type:complete len:92 (-) Transcript_21250:286-561(-)